jgi:hypothetical protein
MKSKEFENFIDKTSKIIERALETSIDVMGTFLEEDSDEAGKDLGLHKGDKI